MSNDPTQRRFLEALHYLTPITVAIFAIVVSIVKWCVIPPSKVAPINERRQSAAKWLTLAITFSYTAEGFLYVFRALVQHGWFASQDSVTYAIGSVLVWGCMFIILAESAPANWLPYIGSWLIGTATDIISCVLSAMVVPRTDNFDNIRLALHVLRIGLLLVLCGVGLFLKPRAIELDTERQPLLEPDSTNPESNTQYGAVPANAKKGNGNENEPEDRDKKIKEQQRKRLEEQGGWLGYLKEFFIFIPYMWPSKNRLLQFYMVIIVLVIISERILNVLVPRQLGIVVNRLTESYGSGTFPWKEIGLWMLMIFLDSRVIQGVKQVLEYRLSLWSNVSITRAAFRHVMGLSMDFHDNKDSGELIQGVAQAGSLNSLLTTLFFDTGPVLLDVIIAVVYVTSLLDIYAAEIVIVAGTVYVIVTYKLTNWNAARRRYCAEKSRNRSKVLYESISNWQTVSYFNREQFEEQRFGKALDEQVKGDIGYYNAAQIMLGSQELVMLFGRLSLCFLAAYRVSQGVTPVGSFVTLNSYWGTLSWPLYMLAYTYKQVNQSLIDAERLLQLLKTKSKVTEKPGAPELKVAGGKVGFTDVTFAYDERKPTINGMSFTANPGSTVALVGETGSGKSTTLKLLFRFYDVSGGSITIDGQNITDVKLSSLRDSIGVVPQDPSLFNLSIMENVRYARLDASDEEVYEACKAASIHDKIMSFPDQYSTKVGERGVKLSGGELQRVSIARVFLKNPKIVILDEATSAIDSSTEAQIQEAFRKLSVGRTTFVIAHRLSTIMDADLILVIDKGEIVERGTHEHLLSQGGKYVELWTKQTSKNLSSNSSVTVGEDNDAVLIPDLPPSSHSSSECSSPNLPNEPSLLDQVDGHSESKHMAESNPKRGGSVRKKIHNLKERLRSGSDDDQDQQEEEPNDNTPLVDVSPRPTVGTDLPNVASSSAPKVQKRRSSRVLRPMSSSSETRAPRHSRRTSDAPKGARRSSIPIPVTTTSPSGKDVGRHDTAGIEPEHTSPKAPPSQNEVPVIATKQGKEDDEDNEITDNEPSVYHTPHATPGSSVKMDRRGSD